MQQEDLKESDDDMDGWDRDAPSPAPRYGFIDFYFVNFYI